MSNKEILNKISYLNYDDLDGFIESLLQSELSNTVGFVNQHSINLMHDDDSVRESFLSLTHLLRDGIGVKLACKIYGIDPKDNFNGTDVIPAIINALKMSNRTVKFFAYGATEPWLTQGSKTLFKTEEVITVNGFEQDNLYIENFKNNSEKSALNCVVLAMGMPKQEKLALMLSSIDVPSLIICGGAIIDFQAGKVKRAPEILRTLGLEWFYRLLVEPKRLFNRYVIGIPKFFYNLVVH